MGCSGFNSLALLISLLFCMLRTEITTMAATARPGTSPQTGNSSATNVATITKVTDLPSRRTVAPASLTSSRPPSIPVPTRLPKAVDGESDLGRGIGIGVGVTSCLVVVVGAVVVVVMWRRRWVLPCAATGESTSAGSDPAKRGGHPVSQTRNQYDGLDSRDLSHGRQGRYEGLQHPTTKSAIKPRQELRQQGNKETGPTNPEGGDGEGGGRERGERGRGREEGEEEGGRGGHDDGWSDPPLRVYQNWEPPSPSSPSLAQQKRRAIAPVPRDTSPSPLEEVQPGSSLVTDTAPVPDDVYVCVEGEGGGSSEENVYVNCIVHQPQNERPHQKQ